jgi:hypothetical protein
LVADGSILEISRRVVISTWVSDTILKFSET